MKSKMLVATVVFVATTVVALSASAARADVVSLTFEGINPTYPTTDFAFVQNFYNGGTSSAGTSGTNFGVGFSDNALAVCSNTSGVFCTNGSRGGLGDPASQQTALFFLAGSAAVMDVAAGFDTGFSFFYTAINQAGSVSVFSGLNGTGSILATLALPVTPSECAPEFGAAFCPFFPIGVSFSGTAHSVAFAGVANQVAFDDVTFGSVTPGLPVPGPIVGAGLAGSGAGERRSACVVAQEAEGCRTNSLGWRTPSLARAAPGSVRRVFWISLLGPRRTPHTLILMSPRPWISSRSSTAIV